MVPLQQVGSLRSLSCPFCKTMGNSLAKSSKRASRRNVTGISRPLKAVGYLLMPGGTWHPQLTRQVTSKSSGQKGKSTAKRKQCLTGRGSNPQSRPGSCGWVTCPTRKRAAGWLHSGRYERRIRYVGIVGDRAPPWVALPWVPPSSPPSLDRPGLPGEPTQFHALLEQASQARPPSPGGEGEVGVCHCWSA